MIPDIGFATIIIALLTSIFAAGASIYGAWQSDQRWIESGRNAIFITFPLLLLSSLILVYLMWTNDFSVQYVAEVTSIDSPKYLKVTALWGSQAGSLLFWNLLLAAFTAISMRRKWYAQRELMPYAIAVAAITQIFFLFLTVTFENPFARLDVVPLDGRGLNPLLRHPGMIIHPPMLYLGLVGFTVPYAFAMAALISGKLDDEWIHTTRRWTLVAWLFLSLGLILGGRWAYDVLGWGGYWGWDPVENASFMPWLAGTAFLHSVMIQEKRHMFKVWNMVLIIVTYLLVIFGTFIVRSGLVSSVHTFAESSIGWFFFGFIAIMILFSVYWLLKRQKVLAAENRLESLLSREAAFLFNNFLIMAILAAVFLGVNFPILTELVSDDKITVGPPYYEKVVGPLFGILVLLMGVAPLTMWHRSLIKNLKNGIKIPAVIMLLVVITAVALGVRDLWALFGMAVVVLSTQLTLLEFWKAARARMRRGENFFTALGQLFVRNQRRYGGYMIHMGVLVMAFGVIGIEFFQQETQLQLQIGDSIGLGKYEAVFQGMSRYEGQDDLVVTEASFDLYKSGNLIGTLSPKNNLYTRTRQPMTIPDVRSTPLEDFYLLLVNWEGIGSDEATFKAYLNPLINWVWAGGAIFIIGTLIAAWPDTVKVPVRTPRRQVAISTD